LQICRGLKVNISKSRAFFSATTRRSKIESMVATIGIRQTFSLEKYQQVLYVDIHDVHLTIADVIQDDTWVLVRLYTKLPSPIVEVIRGTPVCLNGRIQYGFTWKGNLDGIYSVKAGYK